MGLDMYLESTPKIAGLQLSEVKDANEEMYWRESSQIHSWFVINVQNGIDDCDKYEVTRKQLKTLVVQCKSMLSDKDKKTFSTVKENEYYWKDIQDTFDELKPILNYFDFNKRTLFYRSSW